MQILELKSDGQEAIMPQFVDGPVSCNENRTSTMKHVCCVLETCGRWWSALSFHYWCFHILMDGVQFDLTVDEKQS